MIVDTVLRLVDRVLTLFERAQVDAMRHEWMTVTLKRKGVWVRDRRCRKCGAFRRDPAQDEQVCRAFADRGA